MKIKKIIFSIFFIIIILFSIFLIYKKVIKNNSENMQEKNNEVNNQDSTIPDLYIEYNGKRIKATKINEDYDLEHFESSLTATTIDKIFNKNDFYELWNMNNDQEIIELQDSNNIYYMNFSLSNKNEFSIYREIGITYKEGDVGPSISTIYKSGIIISENNGNNMNVGISYGKPGGPRINMYEIYIDGIGFVYYTLKFNCL